MAVHRAIRTIFALGPATMGPANKKEGVTMRVQRLVSWFLGICTVMFVSMLASPAMASAPTEIKKICPDASLTTGPDQIVGQLWGYAEVFGPIIAIGALALLIIVAAVRRLRDKIMPYVIWPLGLLLLFSTAVTIFTSLPGKSC